jgi:hypothetical protein
MTMQRVVFVLALAALIGGAAEPRAARAAAGNQMAGDQTSGDQTLCLDREKLASDMRQAGELIRQGLAKALGTIDAALRTMPRYEMPTLDADGNIIIRRKPQAAPGSEPYQPGRTI